MMSLGPEERNSISSYILPISELRDWLLPSSYISLLTPEFPLKTPSLKRSWHFHLSSKPSSASHLKFQPWWLTLMHKGQDHTRRSKQECFILTLVEMCLEMKKHPRITGIGFGYVRNQFIWYNINPQLYVQNKNAISIAQRECFQLEFIIII